MQTPRLAPLFWIIVSSSTAACGQGVIETGSERGDGSPSAPASTGDSASNDPSSGGVAAATTGGSGGHGGWPAAGGSSVAGSDVGGAANTGAGGSNDSAGSAGSSVSSGGATWTTETRELCADTCWDPAYVNDGQCWDGGPGSDFNTCKLGTDCSDCGVRVIEAPVIGGSGEVACGSGSFGVLEGEKAENFATYDQHGNTLRLSDFCGRWVYIEFGWMGCGACIAHAPKLEEMHLALKDYKEGLVVLDALGENLNPLPPNDLRGTPTQAELMEWVTTYGQTLSAMADPDFSIMGRYWTFGAGTDHPEPLSWPTPQAMLIRPDGTIDYFGQMNQDWLKSKMDGE